MAAIGVGSLVGSIVLLRISQRANKGEPLLSGFFLTGAALVAIGASTSTPLSLVLAVLGGLGGVLFVGLSTVVVQSMSSDDIRARAIAIWAAAFVGHAAVWRADHGRPGGAARPGRSRPGRRGRRRRRGNCRRGCTAADRLAWLRGAARIVRGRNQPGGGRVGERSAARQRLTAAGSE